MKSAHDKIAAEMNDAVAMVPRLTKPEMVRLVEIGQQCRRGRANCGQSPSMTKRLIAKGLVRAEGGKVAKTGRVVWHADAIITDAGRAVLAGLPEADHA